MKTSMEDLTSRLKNNNIRLSHQRLKVLEYMVHNRVHPTVDQIYNSLHAEIPSLSKTTIYNTLNTLIEAGIVSSLTIEDNEVRYDIRTDAHGHFKCKSCRNIYDFEVDTDSIKVEGLNGFRVDTRDFYFSGICSICLDREAKPSN